MTQATQETVKRNHILHTTQVLPDEQAQASCFQSYFKLTKKNGLDEDMHTGVGEGELSDCREKK